MKLKDALSHAMGERNTEADLMESVIGNRAKFVFVASPATDSSSVGSIYNPKKRLTFYAKDSTSSGNRHTWFKGAQALIAAFGTAGSHVATLLCTPATLTFIEGAAKATISFGSGCTKATIPKDGEWNVRVKHFRCLGESIATVHPYKFRFKT